jgi:hypothetical protein
MAWRSLPPEAHLPSRASDTITITRSLQVELASKHLMLQALRRPGVLKHLKYPKGRLQATD